MEDSSRDMKDSSSLFAMVALLERMRVGGCGW
jgi:hypothetical protein